MLIYGVGFGEFITLITPIAGAASYFFKILFAKHKLFFFFNFWIKFSWLFSDMLCLETLQKIFKHTELFKKMRLISCLIYHQFGQGCKDFQIVHYFFNELFFGGFHLHCLTLSLQTLIFMLSMLIRSCLTVFPMNRAPGL